MYVHACAAQPKNRCAIQPINRLIIQITCNEIVISRITCNHNAGLIKSAIPMVDWRTLSPYVDSECRLRFGFCYPPPVERPWIEAGPTDTQTQIVSFFPVVTTTDFATATTPM
jgi:hypothetical protein